MSVYDLYRIISLIFRVKDNFSIILIALIFLSHNAYAAGFSLTNGASGFRSAE